MQGAKKYLGQFLHRTKSTPWSKRQPVAAKRLQGIMSVDYGSYNTRVYVIVLTGGGALLSGLAEYLAKEIPLSVRVAEDPLYVTAAGAAKVFSDKALLNSLLQTGCCR